MTNYKLKSEENGSYSLEIENTIVKKDVFLETEIQKQIDILTAELQKWQGYKTELENLKS